MLNQRLARGFGHAGIQVGQITPMSTVGEKLGRVCGLAYRENHKVA
jgi:hypothetical protein